MVRNTGIGLLVGAILAVAAVGVAGTSAEPLAGDTGGPAIKPRFELYIPSVRTLLEQSARSHSAALFAPVRSMLLELGTASSEGVDATEALGLVEQIKSWPDTAVQAVTYAPDTEGRPRWVLRFDWPLEALHERVSALLESETAETLLEGVSLSKCDAGDGYKITLPESTLAYLLPAGQECAYLASHPDLGIPEGFSVGDPQEQGESPPLLACRLNLAGTEQDSGATGFSAFRAVTGVEYQARIDEQGDWTEQAAIAWPPVSGLGAKAIFGKVQQTFFVPETAFGGLVFDSGLALGMLDSMVGFGPQVMMEQPGELSIVGQAGPGPIATRTSSQACVTLLPGTGFIPFPDIVVQLRTKRPDELIEDIREAIEKVNKLYKDRDQPEPWHESKVRDRSVFWSEGRSSYPGAMMPLVLRPVLTVTKEVDARQRERDILVLAWTSTSPEDLVRRWLELPRGKDRRFLPTAQKTSGQLWINCRELYEWVSPYLNVGLSGLGVETLLPDAEAIRASLTDAEVTAKLKYSGLQLSHRGPLPAGALVVPMLAGMSFAPDESGGSDLARERLACERLRVLHHHCKLFHKDQSRWPAELAELDGYIDFAGHPELLRLQLSSKTQWLRWLEDLAEAPEQEEEEAEDEEAWYSLETDLYVIEWGRERWTLGFEPGTFDHLDQLYIDQDGRIHRVVKQTPAEPEKEQADEPTDEPAVEKQTTSDEVAEAEDKI